MQWTLQCRRDTETFVPRATRRKRAAGTEGENDKKSLPALINKVWLGLRSTRCSSSYGWSLHTHTHTWMDRHTRAHLSASIPVLTDTASPLLIVLEQRLWQRLNLLHQQSYCHRARVSPDSNHQISYILYFCSPLG